MSLFGPGRPVPVTRRLVIAGGIAGALPLAACHGSIVIAGTGAAWCLAAAAQQQLGVTTHYDASYQALTYPGGDVVRKTGVCADVIVRAGRDGLGYDLQSLIHTDMTRAFSAYPALWGAKKPDANIDHRRVPNLEAYFTRHGERIWSGRRGGDAFPEPLEVGDILTWRNDEGASHVALVTRVQGGTLILHNAGHGAMQHGLWPMRFWRAAVGHYRWPKS